MDDKKPLPPEFQQSAVGTRGAIAGLVVLDLDVDNRPKVKIDGTDYPLNASSHVAPMDARHLASLGRRLTTLMQQESLTDEESRELAKLPDTLCRQVLEAPDRVHKKLNDRQRLQVIQTAVGF